MEGVLLHPQVDERGVHRFHRSEVDALRRRRREDMSAVVYTSMDPEYEPELEPSLRAVDDLAQLPCQLASVAVASAAQAAQANVWAEQAQAHALALAAERERLCASVAAAEDQATRRQLDRARAALIEELESYSP